MRASLPVAIGLYKMSWQSAFIISFLGNMVPPIFILLFLDPFSKYLMKHSRFFQRFFNWLFSRTKAKSSTIERYEAIGLAIFVAIPLPMTGAWTGAIAAVLLGIRFFRAVISIGLGVLIADIIVTLSILGIVSLF
ncbi:MAG: COG2426 family protein [bacterium]